MLESKEAQMAPMGTYQGRKIVVEDGRWLYDEIGQVRWSPHRRRTLLPEDKR
jgi:hypothetical protein